MYSPPSGASSSPSQRVGGVEVRRQDGEPEPVGHPEVGTIDLELHDVARARHREARRSRRRERRAVPLPDPEPTRACDQQVLRATGPCPRVRIGIERNEHLRRIDDRRDSGDSEGDDPGGVVGRDHLGDVRCPARGVTGRIGIRRIGDACPCGDEARGCCDDPHHEDPEFQAPTHCETPLQRR